MKNHKELIEVPSLEKYQKIMGYPYWNYSTNSILYLKEFEIGLQGVQFLLNLTAHYKDQLTESEYKKNMYMLWYFHLKLLDKFDHWEEFIETFNKLGDVPEIVHPHGKRHITTDLYWQKRIGIIQRKIERHKKGKSVKNLRHKQLNEISNEEYRRRIEVLKFWMQHGQDIIEKYKEIYKNKIAPEN